VKVPQLNQTRPNLKTREEEQWVESGYDSETLGVPRHHLQNIRKNSQMVADSSSSVASLS